MSDTIIREMTEEDFKELERAEAQPGARIDKSLIPPAILEGLTLYAQEGKPVGSFLEYVICNNLVDAVGKADPYSRVALPSIVSFLYMDMPSICWGSKKVYNAWIAFHQAQRNGFEGEELQAAADKVTEAKNESQEWRQGR
jgi:hypothetical protein